MSEASNVVRKLYTDGRVEEGNWQMTLEDMQQFVGGHIEYVRSSLPHRALIVNDEGLLDNLPNNPNASALVAPGVAVIGLVRGNALLVKA